MADKTIKITSLPPATTEQTIRNALANIKISRVIVKHTEAYVELQDVEDLDILEFSAPQGKLDQLQGATFSKVQNNFTWPSNSPVQELNYDEHEKTEQTPINLTDPNKDHLITISQCDSEILNKLSEEQIKSTVFAHFHSVNRVLKRPNSVIVQLQDTAQKQKLEGVFKELKVPALGNSAQINLDAEDVPQFSSQWISQHHRESGDIKDEDGNPKHCLHEAIIPKLNKMTSMETDFLNSQSSPNAGKIENHHNEIAEQSEEQIQTQNELSDHHENFILNQPAIEQVKADSTHEQEQRIRHEEQQRQLALKKEQERQTRLEQQRLQKQKQQENERKRRQEQMRAEQRQKEIQAQRQWQQLKRQTEEEEKKALEIKRKIQEQAIRISKQAQQASQRELQKVKGFVLNETSIAEASTHISEKIERAKQNLGDFMMGADAKRLQTLLGSEGKTPTVFWAIVLISVLALLVI